MEKKNAETTNNVNESHADPTLNAIHMKLAEHESSHQNINDRLNSIMNNGGSPKNNAHNFFNRIEHNRVVVRTMAIILDANKSDTATVNARLRSLKTLPISVKSLMSY